MCDPAIQMVSSVGMDSSGLPVRSSSQPSEQPLIGLEKRLEESASRARRYY